MARYWLKNPPMHLLVASYMGYEAKDGPVAASKGFADTVASPENETAAQALIHALMGGG